MHRAPGPAALGRLDQGSPQRHLPNRSPLVPIISHHTARVEDCRARNDLENHRKYQAQFMFVLFLHDVLPSCSTFGAVLLHLRFLKEGPIAVSRLHLSWILS